MTNLPQPSNKVKSPKPKSYKCKNCKRSFEFKKDPRYPHWVPALCNLYWAENKEKKVAEATREARRSEEPRTKTVPVLDRSIRGYEERRARRLS